MPMKKLTALMLGLGAGLTVAASPISPDQALARLGGRGKMAIGAGKAASELVYTSRLSSETPVAYVFSNPQNEGFMILSADTRALPMLGYSDNGKFDPENIPDGLKWLLESYSDQLRQAEEKGMPEYSPGDYLQLPAIKPLITTKWDQLSPYNSQTPEISEQHCPTGCVATSLAQTMNYFQYPEEGEGIIVYKWGSKNMALPLKNKKFAWDQMLDTYVEGEYTEEEASAVGFLMKAAGFSVEMDYGLDQSGAFSERIVQAVTKFFKYDPGTWYACRNYYSQTEWYKMIYNNLKDCGPVIYNGSSPLAGGHSFICDGYDGEGYFHINWGWSGLSDGYFSLDILGPDAQGTGGSLGNFSYSQDAVLGMCPSKGGEAAPKYANVQQCGALVGSISGNTLILNTTDGSPRGWLNPTSTQDMNVEFGVMIESISNSDLQYLSGAFRSIEEGDLIGGSVNVRPGHYITTLNYNLEINLPDLSSGEYKVTVVTRDTDIEDSPWQAVLIPYGYANYAYLVVNDGEYEVKNVAPDELVVSNIDVKTTLYKGKKLKFVVTFENPSDLEITACVTPCLVRKEKTMYQAASRLITLPPNSTMDYEWITGFYTLRGADSFFEGQEFTLELKNQDNTLVMGKTEEIPMMPTPANLLVVMNKLSIEDVKSSTVTIGDKEYSRVYMIPDYRDFVINFDYTVKKGYFDTDMTLSIYERDPETDALVKIRQIYSDGEFLEAGETRQSLIPASFSEADTDRIYYLRAEYMLDEVPLYLGQIQLAFATSDVDGIISDSSEEAEYFTPQGIRIQNPTPGQMVIERRGAKVAKKIWR